MADNKVEAIVAKARGNGIFFVLEGDVLRLRVPKGAVTDPELIRLIQEEKEGIKALLLLEARAGSSPNGRRIMGGISRDWQGRLPLSFSQERLWFIHQLQGSIQYHEPSVWRLGGVLHVDSLQLALQEIVNRHEVLRTVIGEEGGQPYQRVLDKGGWSLGIFGGGGDTPDTAALRDRVEALIRAPFDLAVDHPLRAELIRAGEEEHLLVVTLHHIASDGWSMAILVAELVELYGAYVEGRAPQLEPLDLQYADFALWQRNYLDTEVLPSKLGYWKAQLAGAEPLQLPTDFGRPAVQSMRGASFLSGIDEGLTESLRRLALQEGATLYMVLLAAFQVLLHRYSGQEDICVGSPVAGRQQQEIEGLIGFFVNTLVIRGQVSDGMSFRELLGQVKGTTLGAYGHQDVPFEKVVEAVMNQRDQSRNPLFQVLFGLQNIPELPALEFGAVRWRRESVVNNTSKFDLSVMLQEGRGGLMMDIGYCTDLFTEDTVRRMADHYRELLQSVVADADRQVGKLDLVGGAERRQLLLDFNDTTVMYPRDRTVVSLLEEQAQRTPDAVALVFEEESLTYRELDERANQLGHCLRSRGVGRDVLVPLCVQRSMEMVIGILGIWKAGGA
ncbi:MAG TPA: condensation domain-containing protein, partial [Puia sp.]|nr:condensation domain-containing protein [Puia sp.]